MSIPWEKIQRFHQNPPPDFNILFRKRKVTEKYIRHKDRLNRDGIDISDHVIHTVFSDWDQNYRLVENPFPYDVSDDISHMILWVRPGAKVDGIIDQVLSKELGDDAQIVYFRNVPKLQSVPGVEHYQVFVKRNSNK